MNGLKVLLIGTVARGVMWGAGALAAKYGAENISNDTANSIAAFIVAIILALGASVWSKGKDEKLKAADPG